eukprot:scaffold7247_cov484-Prasinococcus_capsulatus_cf.AAC.10
MYCALSSKRGIRSFRQEQEGEREGGRASQGNQLWLPCGGRRGRLSPCAKGRWLSGRLDPPQHSYAPHCAAPRALYHAITSVPSHVRPATVANVRGASILRACAPQGWATTLRAAAQYEVSTLTPFHSRRGFLAQTC